jgi:hypothetical protein
MVQDWLDSTPSDEAVLDLPTGLQQPRKGLHARGEPPVGSGVEPEF